ncbi:hypothetical protein [Rothia sp. HMSC069C10]|uniref:hypothetical protein n=1 Tax=Rothia sp. HMSC069C10 TaxID=1739346 RepID=UPI0008A419B1|nr:hypothetical protein [Rothia sp. HMSC069C10]OFJ79050.1 hypothetical protein HMPREF2842_06435 [Rothia sp. HMSC069C10]
MFVINETLGKLKDYSLAKTLLKGLPKILVSVYAIAIIISFFPDGWVKGVEDGLALRIILEGLNYAGLGQMVDPINSFISRVKNGEEAWVFFLLSILAASSSSYYLNGLRRRIEDYDIWRIVSDPPESIFVLVFSISSLIDYGRIGDFHSSFFIFYNAPICLAIIGIFDLFVLKNRHDGIISSNNKFMLLVIIVGDVLLSFFLSFLLAIIFAPVVLILILFGFVGTQSN